MNGNSSDHLRTLLQYIAKYREYLFFGQPFAVEKITGEDLMRMALDASKSAAGMDGWGTDDMALLPLAYFQWLAELLHLVECGHLWPTDLLHHRASCLSKDPNKPHDPLEYRVLKVMLVVYRRWAGVRLRNLAPWVASWQLDSMFAGVADRSAEDAWYLTGLEVEQATLDAMC